MSEARTAIIIKGNPELIRNNPKADDFYFALKAFLESLDFKVDFDEGEPYTEPPLADLWIGHSRGADRLRFAPPDTIVIGVGVPESIEPTKFPVINHPDDQMVIRKYKEGNIVEGNVKINDSHHYSLTEEMKIAIKKIIQKK